MIVWLASFPRSGNTMFRMLLRTLYDVRTYSLYDESPDKASHYGKGLLESAGSMNVGGVPPGCDKDSELHFVKTHEGPTDTSPAICIVRDGRDALVSYAHFCRTYEQAAADRPFEDVLRDLIVSPNIFNSWTGHLTAWCQHESSAQVVWTRYEDLVKEPSLTVQRCLQQLPVEVPKVADAIPDFAELQRRWPGFYRKGQAGSWKQEMPEDLHRLFWQHHAAMMERFGYLEGKV